MAHRGPTIASNTDRTAGTPSRSRTAAGLVALMSLVPVAEACGQGAVSRERWVYADLEAMRRTLADACRGRDAETLAAVARDLVSDARGDPFLPVLRALSRLRGVEADDAFRFRGSLRVLARPEVVDPVGDNLVCRSLNATFFLPYRIPDPTGGSGVRLEVTVRDGEGETVFGSAVKEPIGMEDLLAYEPTVEVPGEGLADGAYTLEVRVLLDGEPPRPGDLLTETRFFVLRGYQQRVEELGRRIEALLAEDLEVRDRAVLMGAWAPVYEAYTSRSPDGRSDAPGDLRRAERVAANLAAGEAPLSGLGGRMDLGLPVGDDEVVRVALVLPETDAAPRPLLLFVPGAPTYDHDIHRPTAPRFTRPGWWADLLEDRNLRSLGWNWAVMESPGRVGSSMAALEAVTAGLQELLGVPDGRICLVGERQAAWVAAHGLTDPAVAGRIGALVLLTAGGNLSLQAVEDHELPVLALPSHGHVSSPGLERLAARSETDLLRVGDSTSRPWATALSASLPEIEAFLESLGWD